MAFHKDNSCIKSCSIHTKCLSPVYYYNNVVVVFIVIIIVIVVDVVVTVSVANNNVSINMSLFFILA